MEPLTVALFAIFGIALWYREREGRVKAETELNTTVKNFNDFISRPAYVSMTDNQIVLFTRMMLEEAEKIITANKSKKEVVH